MKQYKLAAWPDLPAPFHRTAYRRMLHQMSHRHVSVRQLMQESGLARSAVVQFLDTLTERELLSEREHAAPLSMLGRLRPVAWWRRTFAAAGHV
ncbi:helix-turn-helix domain-containing protein [Methylibium sp.]|uniref:helix-turn-helix domain-containing protein n=1 Tax=Methylibium sp. TaxID=2067992 RepID=UPI003D1410F9